MNVIRNEVVKCVASFNYHEGVTQSDIRYTYSFRFFSSAKANQILLRCPSICISATTVSKQRSVTPNCTECKGSWKSGGERHPQSSILTHHPPYRITHPASRHPSFSFHDLDACRSTAITTLKSTPKLYSYRRPFFRNTDHP
jgi:hypothetical protein